MKLLEVKNNLIKLSYDKDEHPILGRFLILVSEEKSYVAQFLNLKSDSAHSFAIAKLLFTFTSDGVVDNYDGSIPSINSELSFLDSGELLDLLPIETPIKIANLAQQDDLLKLDISVFEHNFTVFTESNSIKTTFISNCIRQLFQLKEKSVIIDSENLFEDYPKIVFTEDFKLPLNSEMIDYLFKYELSEVNAETKAVIQDIFYAVQQYIKTLDFEFLPIDNFIEVVANQYKETQMPELALLKNKLLKYRDLNIFANTKEEVLVLDKKLQEKNCTIIDVQNVNESLQKEVIMFVHEALSKLDKFVYYFVSLTDDNSDKLLLRRFINNNHVFTTFMASHSYKYANELKMSAENVMLFAPQTQQHNFAAYNIYLNKLSQKEGIVYGTLTQGVPFIVELSDLDLDLTRDDVLGDKFQFLPKIGETILVRINENGERILLEPYYIPVAEEDADGNIITSSVQNNFEKAEEVISNNNLQSSPQVNELAKAQVEPKLEVLDEGTKNIENESSEILEEVTVSEPELSLGIENNDSQVDVSEDYFPSTEINPNKVSPLILEPVANIMDDGKDNVEVIEEDLPEEDNFDETVIEDPSVSDDLDNVSFEDESLPLEEELTELSEDDLDFIDSLSEEESSLITEPESEIVEQSYTETPYVDEQPPVVPVYPSEDENNDDGIDFAQGDSVSHPRYGRGVVEKIIKYGNKTLCSISFENVGRRLLDPTVSEFTKIEA